MKMQRTLFVIWTGRRRRALFEKNKLLCCSDTRVRDFILRLTAYLIIRDDMSRKNL